MIIRRRSVRFVAMALVVSLPLLGMSGVASAKAAKAAKGCHKTHSCKSGTGVGGGTGAPPAAPTMVVTADPDPLVETGLSSINTVVQVETSPSFAGDEVEISSSQLIDSCGIVYFQTVQPAPGAAGYDNTFYTTDSPIEVTLDNDGNVTLVINGTDCAPGPDLIDASLVAAPYYTAITTLVAEPPNVTAPGVTVYPNPEVETGEDMTSVDDCCGECEEECEEETIDGSDVYAVFYVETNPVYAELPVQISDTQLEDSCGGGFDWYTGDYNEIITTSPPAETLDNDGNAVFVFFGTSCAPTTSEVVADVDAGTHPTYTTTFTVLPPTPTI
jgi:hypothetical protein